MIVVDTNLVVYLVIPGDYTALAEETFRNDPDWVAPSSWRSEFVNVLSTYCRTGRLQIAQAVDAWNRATAIVRTVPIEPDVSRVLQLSLESRCSGYDCIFVAVAQMNNLPLVTFDQQLLTAFMHTATRPEGVGNWFPQRRST